MAHDPLPKPNIVAVFEHFQLEVIGADRGGWRKAQCPLPDHDDRNPSASINEDACRWRCHACDEGGDAIDLVVAQEGLTFAEALRYVRENFEGDGRDNSNSNTGGSSLLPGRSAGPRAKRGSFSAPWLRM